MSKAPAFLKQYFWDIDFAKLDFNESRTFILKRVLDRGDTKALNWLSKNFTKKEIEKLILSSRDLSQKTANFWADFLNIDHKKVPCLQKPYSRTPFGLSS